MPSSEPSPNNLATQLRRLKDAHESNLSALASRLKRAEGRVEKLQAAVGENRDALIEGQARLLKVQVRLSPNSNNGDQDPTDFTYEDYMQRLNRVYRYLFGAREGASGIGGQTASDVVSSLTQYDFKLLFQTHIPRFLETVDQFDRQMDAADRERKEQEARSHQRERRINYITGIALATGFAVVTVVYRGTVGITISEQRTQIDRLIEATESMEDRKALLLRDNLKHTAKIELYETEIKELKERVRDLETRRD